MKNRLRAEREKSRLTQAEVAKLLDLDFTTVCRHENGDVPDHLVEAYARVFKIPAHRIFLDEKEFPAK